MAIIYRIYTNGGTGGPVDYSVPIATTTGAAVSGIVVSNGSDTTFAVRALDDVSNKEEANTDARVRILVDNAGQDVSGRPNPPHALSLASSTSGACRVSWAYAPAARFIAPLGFHVYLSEESNTTTVISTATVEYSPGKIGYSYVFVGPYPQSTYTAAVRSFNAAGEDAGPSSISGVIGIPPNPLNMEQVVVVVN
jgi:hypothetical protein